MPESQRSLPAIHQGDPHTDLTEEAVRAWLETFYASEGVVSKADIAHRLSNRAAFWKD